MPLVLPRLALPLRFSTSFRIVHILLSLAPRTAGLRIRTFHTFHGRTAPRRAPRVLPHYRRYCTLCYTRLTVWFSHLHACCCIGPALTTLCTLFVSSGTFAAGSRFTTSFLDGMSMDRTLPGRTPLFATTFPHSRFPATRCVNTGSPTARTTCSRFHTHRTHRDLHTHHWHISTTSGRFVYCALRTALRTPAFSAHYRCRRFFRSRPPFSYFRISGSARFEHYAFLSRATTHTAPPHRHTACPPPRSGFTHRTEHRARGSRSARNSFAPLRMDCAGTPTSPTLTAATFWFCLLFWTLSPRHLHFACAGSALPRHLPARIVDTRRTVRFLHCLLLDAPFSWFVHHCRAFHRRRLHTTARLHYRFARTVRRCTHSLHGHLRVGCRLRRLAVCTYKHTRAHGFALGCLSSSRRNTRTHAPALRTHGLPAFPHIFLIRVHRFSHACTRTSCGSFASFLPMRVLLSFARSVLRFSAVLLVLLFSHAARHIRLRARVPSLTACLYHADSATGPAYVTLTGFHFLYGSLIHCNWTRITLNTAFFSDTPHSHILPFYSL